MAWAWPGAWELAWEFVAQVAIIACFAAHNIPNLGDRRRLLVANTHAYFVYGAKIGKAFEFFQQVGHEKSHARGTCGVLAHDGCSIAANIAHSALRPQRFRHEGLQLGRPGLLVCGLS